MYKRRMPQETRLRRLMLLRELYSCKDVITNVYRRPIVEKNGKLEKMVGKFKSDGKFMAWNAYRLIQHGNMVTSSAMTTDGCIGGCLFCVHGRSPLVRRLVWQEIVSQPLHVLDGLLAHGVFEKNTIVRPCLHLTGKGEPLSNRENVLEAIKRLAMIRELMFSFIITTIGLVKDLKALFEDLKRIDMDLKRLRIYLSINFPFSEIRGEKMPATKGQDLLEVRDLGLQLEELTGNKLTAAFLNIPGINDRDDDFQKMADEWGMFDIKLQAFAPSPGFHPFPTATPAQLDESKRKLEQAGAKSVRIRTVIGGFQNAGCGSDTADPELL